MPMLFVIAMDVLNAMIAKADRRHILATLPGGVIKFRASLYADDLVLFVLPKNDDLHCLRVLLDLFARASGLPSNLNKCPLAPIRCSDQDVQVFPCNVT